MPSIAEDLDALTLAVSQLSFYFGVLAALGIVQAVIEGAEGEGAIEIALDGLRDEVEGFIEASGETINVLSRWPATRRSRQAAGYPAVESTDRRVDCSSYASHSAHQ